MNQSTNTNQQPKRQTVVEKEVIVNADGMAEGVKFTFAIGAPRFVSLESLTPVMLYRAAAHGIAQKGGDAAAMSRNPDTGKSASAADKIAAVNAILDRVEAGEWNLPREAGAGSGNTLLLKALCRVYPKRTPEELREWLAGKSDKEKTSLRGNAKIAAAIADIQAESVADVDSDELLDELDGE